MTQYEKQKLISIARPGAVCALCGGSLAGQPKHPSALRRAEDLPPQEREDGSAPEGDGAAPASTDAAQATPASGAESKPVPPDEAISPRPSEQDADDDAPEFIRSDYHAECWNKVRKGDHLSFWLATRPAPPPERKLSKQERNRVLLALFSALAGSEDPIDEPTKFVLSHLLMKYKALALSHSRLDAQGRKWIVFQEPKTEETYEIPDIRLDDEQLVETMGRIDAYLAQAGPEPEAPPEQNDDKGDERN